MKMKNKNLIYLNWTLFFEAIDSMKYNFKTGWKMSREGFEPGISWLKLLMPTNWSISDESRGFSSLY